MTLSVECPANSSQTLLKPKLSFVIAVATIRETALIAVSDRREYVPCGDALGGTYYLGHFNGGIGINRE